MFAKFTGKHLCRGLLIEKETPTQVFFCEFSEIFKNTFFAEHLRKTASVFYRRKKNMLFALSWKEQRRYDTAIFLLEIIEINFLAQRKPRVKLVKPY